MSKGKRLEIEQHLHFCACRRDCSLPHALAAPCLLIRRDWGTDQLETVVLSSSPFCFQQLFPLQEPGEKEHALAGGQEESHFPLTFGTLIDKRQFRASRLESSSVHFPGRRREGLLPCWQQRAHTAWPAAPCPRYKPCLSTEAGSP